MKYLSSLILVIISVSIFAYEVGNYNTTFIDEERDNREVDVEIFYPANAEASETFPVVIFGHGWLMTYNSYEEFTQEMVSNGLILVFPKTEENLFPNHQNLALDISFLKSKIQSENENESSNLHNIVMNKTFASGHSMGGGTSVFNHGKNFKEKMQKFEGFSSKFLQFFKLFFCYFPSISAIKNYLKW